LQCCRGSPRRSAATSPIDLMTIDPHNVVVRQPGDEAWHHSGSWKTIMKKNKTPAPKQHQRHHTLFDIVRGQTIVPIVEIDVPKDNLQSASGRALWPDLAKTRISARDARSNWLRTVQNGVSPRLIRKTHTKLISQRPMSFQIRQFLCGRYIIRAATGIFRSRTVSAQLIESVPVNTIANLTNAGKAGS
jgi:hypothetical protein